MTAADIQRTLMVERYQRNFVLPNYTPRNWWECDVFELTPGGFFREYEIKVSRGDFFKDATKKEQSRYWLKRVEGASVEGAVKHDLLRDGSNRAPNQFWFVVPEDLVAVTEVPEWAGLIYARSAKTRYITTGGFERELLRLTETKKAPFIHRNKIDPAIRSHAEGICYWRMHHLLVRRENPSVDFSNVVDGAQ